MRLNELRQALREAEPAAVLVAPRVLEHLIQETWKLPALVWSVPHRKSLVIDRHELFRHVEQEELNLEPDRLLPLRVILLAKPSAETLNTRDPEQLWLKYWRRLFHASVHLALEKSPATVASLAPEVVPARIEELGEGSFEEIRSVLLQDRYIVAEANDYTVYIEFASLYLELKYFAANLLPVYFPGLRDLARVDRMLAQDVDAEAIFHRTRLKGAPEPVFRTDNSSDESHDYYWSLIQNADEAKQSGNVVRSAILRTQAARVAPADLATKTRHAAEEELRGLTTRLQAALQLTEEEASEWLQVLPALLDKSDQGQWPVEASLLFDLQKVCLDNERDIYALDVVEWVLSAGKKPIKRWLPSQRLVRVTKHLRTATQRLTKARLTDTDRTHLSTLLHTAMKRSEDRLRARFRPVLTDALHDAGLVPRNPPERTAFFKLVEECLDRITDYGYLTFSDLRDALSRNQLKLPDLSDPQDFVRGDPLLRLDRRLSSLLDGVYRPSEFYLRGLERLTALNFGTRLGRMITRFVTLPFGGAAVTLLATEYLLKMVHLPGQIFPSDGFQAGWDGWLWPISLILLMGLFYLGLLHNTRFRERCAQVGRGILHGLHLCLIDLPWWLMHVEVLQRLAASWAFQLLYWYCLKPLLLTLLLVFPFRKYFLEDSWLRLGGVFLIATLGLNSRTGQAANEALWQGAARLYQLLGTNLFLGLYQLLSRVFKRIVEAFESMLFTVEEWLRFQSGESQFSMVLRTILGVLWFPISYLARFYTVVLIEPGFNPIKAPLAILAAKFVYPLTIKWLLPGTPEGIELTTGEMAELFIAQYGLLGMMVILPTWWLLPDAVAFLCWEMKENWRLYQANRSPQLQPQPVGSHGETVRALLEPGLHSGTLPKLFRKLRRAEREAAESGNWRTARTYRRELEEVEECVQRFVAREVVMLLQQSHSWRTDAVSVGKVSLAINRIRIELSRSRYPRTPLCLQIELCAGWLVGGISEEGWLPHLSPEQRHALTSALANLYRLAGVDLVREQVTASLAPTVASYEIHQEGLVVWTTPRQGAGVVYDLREPHEMIHPRPQGADGATATAEWPPLQPQQLLFSRVPLAWDRWVQTWQRDKDGMGHERFLQAGVELLAHPAEPVPNAAPPRLDTNGAHREQPAMRSIHDLATEEAYHLVADHFGEVLPPLEAIENEDWGRDYVMQKLIQHNPEELAALGLTRDGAPEPADQPDA